MAHSTIKISFTIQVYMYFDVETVSFVLNATDKSYTYWHTQILWTHGIYQEAAKVFANWTHTHKFKWKVPKSVVYKIAIIINVTYYNNIIDQQPLSLSCNAAKDPLN